MLITADIAKRQSGNSAAGHALKIQGPSAPGEDLDRVTAGADQEHRPIGKKNLILIDTGSDKDLIEFAGFLQSGARSRIERRVLPIHDQRSSAERILRRILAGGP